MLTSGKLLRGARHALLGAALILTGVSGAVAADKTDIVVGFTSSQTGPASTDAADVQRVYDMWRDQTNAAGGIFVKDLGKKLPVKFVNYDDKSDPSTAAKLYDKLITDDKVDLLLSPWGSGINFAVTAVTNKHDMNLILTSASSDGIYGRGYKYIFQATELASRDAGPLVEALLAHKDQIKTVAILVENNIFAETIYEAFKKAIDGKGLKVVMTEKFPPAGQSFGSLLIKAKSLNPDALLAFALPPSSIYITRQLYEVGELPKFYYVLTGPMFKEFKEALGAHADGVVEHGFWHPSLPYPGTKEFAAAFDNRFHRPPSTDAAHAKIATQVLVQAIEKAGSLDQKKLNAVLHSATFNTIGGPYRYDEAGRNVLEKQFLVQMQGGVRTIVWPKDLASSTLRIPGLKN